MSGCDTGYICSVCGSPVAGLEASALYLRFVMGRLHPDELWTGTEQHLVCRSRDDGSAEIPTAAAARLADPGVSDGRLSLYRVSRSSFTAEGLDEGEAQFVASVTVPLRTN